MFQSEGEYPRVWCEYETYRIGIQLKEGGGIWWLTGEEADSLILALKRSQAYLAHTYGTLHDPEKWKKKTRKQKQREQSESESIL